MRYKLDKAMAWMLNILLFVIFLVMLMWYFIPGDPVKICEDTIQILNEKVVPGEELQYSLYIDKKMEITGTLSRMLIRCENNGFGGIEKVYILVQGAGSLPVGKHKVYVDVMIPLTVDPGKYKLKTTIEFKMNPLRSVTRSYETPCFQVVAKK